MKDLEKEALRQATLAKLRAFSFEQLAKKQIEQQLITELFQTTAWQTAQTVGLYRSMPHEFNTIPILKQAFIEGKRVALPVVVSQRRMEFRQVTPTTTFTKTAFGVEEPQSTVIVSKETIDLLVVPGVAFTQTGYRIGYGGGFYDNYLSDFSGKTISCVLPVQQLTQSWKPDRFDLPVDQLLSIKEEERSWIN